MKVLPLAVISAVLLLGLDAASADGQLVCIRPVPLTIKELATKQAAGSLSEEALKLNVDYLTLKYCALVDGVPDPASSVSLGSGCEMKWGSRLGETIYWATCEDGLRQLSLGNINRALPSEIAVAQNVFETIRTHSFFADAPRIAVAHYKNYWDTTINRSGRSTSSNEVKLLRLSGQFLREETSSNAINFVNKAELKSAIRTISVTVANDFISLGSITTSVSRYKTSRVVNRTTAIDGLVGHLYPVEVGNFFRFRTHTRIESRTAGTRYADVITTTYFCNVVRKYNANIFYSTLAGNAYLVHCDSEIAYQKMKSANTRTESNVIFFEGLGAWISADPMRAQERVISNPIVSFVAGRKYVDSGFYELKDVGLAK